MKILESFDVASPALIEATEENDAVEELPYYPEYVETIDCMDMSVFAEE